MIAVVAVLVLGSLGVGAALNNRNRSSLGASSGSTNNTNDGMAGMGSQPTTTNIPDATQPYGNQPAKYVMDKDGAKHFTLTAQQVMW